MEIYEVFKCEGGYKVCLVPWGENDYVCSGPGAAPWFATEAEAIDYSHRKRFSDVCENEIGYFQVDEGRWDAVYPTSPYGSDYASFDDKYSAASFCRKEIHKLGYTDDDIKSFASEHYKQLLFPAV
jgi:hypothetical protein